MYDYGVSGKQQTKRKYIDRQIDLMKTKITFVLDAQNHCRVISDKHFAIKLFYSLFPRQILLKCVL